MADDKEFERVGHLKARAVIRRTSIISAIRAINSLALRTSNEPDVIPEFLVAVTDLETLWAQFRSEDESVLDYLISLNKDNEYSPDLSSEVRALIHSSKAIATRLVPKGAEAIDLSYLSGHANLNQGSPSSPMQPADAHKPLSRLPEIPLPQFNGDFRYWPTFRDRFVALVDTRPNLSNIEKLYYLIGCLKGSAADAIRSIPVSSDNYTLAWNTLVERFHRPRMVASTLIEKILCMSSLNQESLVELNGFVSQFSENMSLLRALNIPDVGSFILFSVAFRCLPLPTRKLFESTTKADYPSIDDLLTFVRERVSILELVGDPRKSASVSGPSKSSAPFRTGGDRTWKVDKQRPTSLVAAKPDGSSCPCCAGSHVLGSCNRFKSWSVDERMRWAREKRLCYNCFGGGHWAPRCNSKERCRECSRRHHPLLHPPANVTRHDDLSPSAEASLCAATPPQQACGASSVILGTALVHVRARSGAWHTLRALIDCASQISAITTASADRLGLKRTRWTNPVSGLAGVPIVDVRGRVECTVQPRFATGPVLSVQAWVLSSITGDLPRNTLSTTIKNEYSTLALADPTFNVTSAIDLLLGGDVYSSIMDGRKIIVDKSLPAAFSSIFGWILIGPIYDGDAIPYRSIPVTLTASIEGLMERFWQTEEPGEAPVGFTEEGQCEQVFSEQCVRLASGRFSVPLPFRTSVTDDTFTGSRELAVKRFEALERKFKTNPRLRSLYVDFMSEYLKLGHMSVAESPGCYFIPGEWPSRGVST